jgi:hypothetical protein
MKVYDIGANTLNQIFPKAETSRAALHQGFNLSLMKQRFKSPYRRHTNSFLSPQPERNTFELTVT